MRRIVPIAAITVVLGCTRDDARSAQVEASVRDSVGIEIVETDGSRARSPSLVSVRSEPEIQIGALDGDQPYLFSNIADVVLVPGNRILVVDLGSVELRFFDLRGEFIERTGGRGEGPGEFETPRFLNPIRGDSLAFFDGRTRRVTIYPPYPAEGFRVFSATSGAARRTSGSQVLQTSGVITFGADAIIRSPMELVLIDVEQQTEEAIAHFETVFVNIARSGGLPPLGTSIPYMFLMTHAADRDGFYVNTPDGPYLLRYSWTGELRRIIRLVEPVNEVTAAEFRTELDRRAASFADGGTITEQAYMSAFDDVAPPAIEPAFDKLVVDDEGWVWARVFEVRPSEGGTTWLVFDSTGRGQGSVRMPDGLSVSTISRDYVAGVWRDELGVEYVRLHRIDGR